MDIADVLFIVPRTVVSGRALIRRADPEMARKADAIDLRVAVLHIEPRLEPPFEGFEALDPRENGLLPRCHRSCSALNQNLLTRVVQILDGLLPELKVLRPHQQQRFDAHVSLAEGYEG